MNETADNGGSGLERAIERPSHSASSLLLLGELGVGKCRAARAIHQRSERSTSPFMYVNCGTLADHVTADRVFGAALATGPAPCGTLYLDQVECSSPNWQGRVSELLSCAGRGYRLMAGGKRELAHDARVGLAGLELCRHINQSRIHLLPLRDRPHEIIPAALQFLKTDEER